MAEHDFNHARWGHSCDPFRKLTNDGHRWTFTGYGRGIVVGDVLLVEGTRYVVDNIRYMDDPSDQFFADATWHLSDMRGDKRENKDE